MLKIAIDSGPLKSGDSVRGIGVYVRELTKYLRDVDVVDFTTTNLGNYDLVHLTRFNPFFISVPFTKPKNTKFVLTIYDLIPLVYPSNFPPGVKGKIKLLINKYLITKNVDAIITISETSKKDICRFLGIDPSKVFVTYLAPRAVFKKNKNAVFRGLPNKFVLYVGDVNYNKNIPGLVEACKICSLPLVIVGKQAKDIKDGKTSLAHPELRHLKDIDWKDIITLGFIDDINLVKIYNRALVFVQPSYYEGFGLGVLDANACGTPVVAAKNQCLVEVLGSDFMFVDPTKPSQIAKGIQNPNVRISLPRQYSWQKTALDTHRVYNKVLET